MPIEGIGPHRIWYVGGRYAYASIHFADFTDHILAIIDMADPRKPQVVGRCWLPGMWRGGGETPSWPAGKRYALHHALVDGNIAYAAWRDGGLTVIDVADPARPKILVHRLPQPGGGGTHSPLPLPDRKLLVLADEPTFANCKEGRRHIWTYDVREPSNPALIALLPGARRSRLLREGRVFRPAQPAREPSGRRSRAHASSSPPTTTRACGSTTSPTRRGRRRSRSTCRPIRRRWWIRGRTGRRCCRPPTAMSTATGSCT